MGRINERAGDPIPTRIRLLEGDVDKMEEHMDEIRGMVRAEVKEIRDDVKGLNRITTGAAIALATSAFMFAVNVLKDAF